MQTSGQAQNRDPNPQIQLQVQVQASSRINKLKLKMLQCSNVPVLQCSNAPTPPSSKLWGPPIDFFISASLHKNYENTVQFFCYQAKRDVESVRDGVAGDAR